MPGRNGEKFLLDFCGCIGSVPWRLRGSWPTPSGPSPRWATRTRRYWHASRSSSWPGACTASRPRSWPPWPRLSAHTGGLTGDGKPSGCLCLSWYQSPRTTPKGLGTIPTDLTCWKVHWHHSHLGFRWLMGCFIVVFFLRLSATISLLCLIPSATTAIATVITQHTCVTPPSFSVIILPRAFSFPENTLPCLF